MLGYGVSDSQRAYLTAALKSREISQILVVTADSLEAKNLTEDLMFFKPGRGGYVSRQLSSSL